MHQRLKLYLFLPLLALPFVTIAFACLGGGTAAERTDTPAGAKMRLPDARPGNDSAQDKLSFYAQASRDAATLAQQRQNDPYSVPTSAPVALPIDETIQSIRERVYAQQRHDVAPAQTALPAVSNFDLPARPVQSSAGDPDLAAINQAIDKLAALQSPVGVSTMKATAKRDPQVVAVRPTGDDDATYFGASAPVKSNRFFVDQSAEVTQGGMTASVPVTQVIQPGSVIKLVLHQAVTAGGAVLPAGTAVFGTTAMQNERLLVRVSSVRVKDCILPVDLSVYDADGLEGIYVPGSLSREVLRSAAEQSMESVNVLSLDPGFKTQAAMAGIGAVKQLFSKKVKTVRVTVAAGYQVYLRDAHSNQAP